MAVKTLGQVRTEVESLIKDVDKVVTEAEKNNFIQRAVRVLSKRSPRVVFEEKTGDGTTFQWAISTTNWLNGFSIMRSVQYPFDDTEQDVATYVSYKKWDVYEKDAGSWYIRLLETIPSSSETLRFTYTTTHALVEASGSGNTITDPDNEDSVIYLAASLCLRAMAAKAVAIGNPTLNADVVNYQSRSGEYSRLADMYEKLSGLSAYVQLEGIGALVWSNLDTRDAYGYPLLTHPESTN